MRLCPWPFPAVLATAEHGIEKVRGSTPLISTIPIVCKIQGFPRVLLYAAARPEKGWTGVLQHFTTLRRVQARKGGKCAHK